MEQDRELEQLKMLFDYTKFHIGLYTTVATIFGAVIAAEKSPFTFSPALLFTAIIFICIAGAAGGTIASSIPGCSRYSEFMEAKIAPFNLPGFRAEYWTYIEHTAFWIAVVLAVLSIAPK